MHKKENQLHLRIGIRNLGWGKDSLFIVYPFILCDFFRLYKWPIFIINTCIYKTYLLRNWIKDLVAALVFMGYIVLGLLVAGLFKQINI